MIAQNTIPERTLLPRREGGGGRSSSPAPAATQVAPPRLPALGAATSTGLRVGGFSSHPGAAARDPLPVGYWLPKRSIGVGFEIAGRSASQRKANAFGMPFGSDCLSKPRRQTRSGVPGGGAQGGAP